MVQFMSCVHGKPDIFELKNINMKKIWSNNKRSDANRISEYKENYVNYFNTCPVLKGTLMQIWKSPYIFKFI